VKGENARFQQGRPSGVMAERQRALLVEGFDITARFSHRHTHACTDTQAAFNTDRKGQ